MGIFIEVGIVYRVLLKGWMKLTHEACMGKVGNVMY